MPRTVASTVTLPHYSYLASPVHKDIINDDGVLFSGHTEFFADRIGRTSGIVLAIRHLPWHNTITKYYNE
ncbi:MAG: hypothetical protein ACFC1C_04065 [Candidatus Malihini olakiniferum]